jgi:hypothetical protein
MGAWLNNSSTNARLARESTARGGYATGYYQPMIVPMGASSPNRQETEGSLATRQLAYRDAQYNQLKDEYVRSLFVTAGLAATVIYLFVTRGRS